MAMGFLAMFTVQLDNTKVKISWHPIAVMGVVDTFGPKIVLNFFSAFLNN